MPFHRNFTYWIDKRKWKYYFLMVSLQLDKEAIGNRQWAIGNSGSPSAADQ
jgi:hypothetical protein